MFRLALLAQLALTAAIDAGDCAFVGIYGEKDDFAVVLLEDADGEKLSLTDKLGDKGFKVGRVAEAQGELKRGTVLKKGDFSGASFLAPAALTLFKGDAESPSVLCTIKMEGKGSTERRLDEVMMDLGEVDSAQYAGPVEGSKDSLLEQILNRQNWETRSAHIRQLQGFSVAHNHGMANMTTTMMTTMMNTTMGMMTTTSMDMMTTTMDDMTTEDEHDHEHIEIEGCIGFTSTSADELLADSKVVMAMKTAIASLIPGVMASNIVELTLMKGMCSNRRLSERQLSEEAVVANYKIELPPESAEVAQAAQAALTDATVEQVQSAIATELTSASLSYTVTVTTVTAPTLDMPGTTKKATGGAYGQSILGLLMVCLGAM